jgi:electron transfer flavoprotein alpha subunit
MRALVLAEHDNLQLASATLHAVTAAVALGGEVDLLVAGQGSDAAAAAAAKVQGVSRVILVEDAVYAEPMAEDLAGLLQAMAPGYDALLAASTTFGKNVMPRVAALLDVAQLSDIVEVVGPDTFKRYVYAGNALATVRTSDAVKVITVRVTAFDAAPAEGGDAAIEGLASTMCGSWFGFTRVVTATWSPPSVRARLPIQGSVATTFSSARAGGASNSDRKIVSINLRMA